MYNHRHVTTACTFIVIWKFFAPVWAHTTFHSSSVNRSVFTFLSDPAEFFVLLCRDSFQLSAARFVFPLSYTKPGSIFTA
ncbi:hypothetical protein GGS20DRAFT_537578 [Poronia punctata]|nr:hypothetical protein GGS20DRAFT_537578 [Poronia punctata]